MLVRRGPACSPPNAGASRACMPLLHHELCAPVPKGCRGFSLKKEQVSSAVKFSPEEEILWRVRFGGSRCGWWAGATAARSLRIAFQQHANTGVVHERELRQHLQCDALHHRVLVLLPLFQRSGLRSLLELGSQLFTAATTPQPVEPLQLSTGLTPLSLFTFAACNFAATILFRSHCSPD